MLKAQASKSRRASGEDGNIIIALTIILVVVTIAAALLSRVVGNQSIVVSRQDTAKAVSGADAGIADALFRLDQLPVDSPVTSICVDSANPGNCGGATIPGASDVGYVATKVNDTTWKIQAQGMVNGKQGAVQELVTRGSKFPFALFGNTSLNFNGNTDKGGSFSTYDPTQTTSGSNPNPNGGVWIGSNGTISCTQQLGSNVTPKYYATGGIGSLSTACGADPESYSYVYYLPTPQTPANAQPCPAADGKFGTGSSVPSIGPGTYVCTQPILINGTLTVNGQVSLYVILDPAQYNSSTNAITINANAYVNADPCVATLPAGCHLPDAANFQLYTNSNGSVGNDNGQGYYFGGVIYAPQASLTQDGCKSNYYGSIIISALTCNGGPHLTVNYDSALAFVYGAWTVGSYTQINPSDVNIP